MSINKKALPRPQNKTLNQTVEYLASLGLSVYGNAACLESGLFIGGLKDYSPEEVVQYRKLHETGKLHWEDV